MSVNERHRAELRDAAARSRLAYANDMDAMRERLRLVAEPSPDANANADTFRLAGHIAECVTALEERAADADDADLSRAVAGLRSQVTRVGNVLARRRAMYREGGPDA
jgi:hypothetical protein